MARGRPRARILLPGGKQGRRAHWLAWAKAYVGSQGPLNQVATAVPLSDRAVLLSTDFEIAAVAGPGCPVDAPGEVRAVAGRGG